VIVVEALEVVNEVKENEQEIIEPVVNSEDIMVENIKKYFENILLNIDDTNDEELNKYQNIISKIHNKIIINTQQLINCSENCSAMTNRILEQKEKLRKESIKKNKKFDTLKDLISVMTNVEQVKRILKILRDNDDYCKIYLQGFTKNTDNKKNTLVGTLKILGQYNLTKGVREEYQIKIFQNETHTFWCSCIDHKLNSNKKNILCKHISFIVCKVMKIYELDFFETKKITDKQMQDLLNIFSDKSDLWKNKNLVRDFKLINLDTYKQFPEPINDTCSFCYDELTNKDKNVSVCCPSCKHTYHSECIEIWLENYLHCSICFSDIWKHYNTVKTGAVININNETV
jgi:hypothetical protein